MSATTKAPSSYRVAEAMTALLRLRDELIAIDPEIEQDDRLLLDMLDAEGGDAVQIIERVIRASIEANALADAAKRRKQEIDERKARFERRRDALRRVALDALSALGVAKLEREDFTASIRAGQPHVVVTDIDALPDAFRRVKVEAEKALIHAAFKSGHSIPGAEISNTAPSLTVRVT
jgi:hypothetical protein